MERLQQIYRHRFNEEERRTKARVWKVLCEHYFQRYVPVESTVLDLACGLGEFSRFIDAAEKIAVDLNPESSQFLPADVRFVPAPADDLGAIESDSVDICFTSNFFEHLPDKQSMNRVLTEVRRVLRPGARFLVLQPNIRYAADRYWDFYDHHLPLSHLSAKEGFEANGFRIVELVPRFLPWSTKSRLSKHPVLVWIYLQTPLAWRLLGRQFFLVAEKPAAEV